MKRRVLQALTVLALVGVAVYLLQQYVEVKSYVEPYCSATYQHDVDNYKVCKAKTPQQILKEITAKESTKAEVPTLPIAFK